MSATTSKIANPGSLGLLGFGMTTVLLNLHNAGLLPLSIVIVAMGIALGGLAQIIAGGPGAEAGQYLCRYRFHRLRPVCYLQRCGPDRQRRIRQERNASGLKRTKREREIAPFKIF